MIPVEINLEELDPLFRQETGLDRDLRREQITDAPMEENT
jgi:hypothetical protein